MLLGNQDALDEEWMHESDPIDTDLRDIGLCEGGPLDFAVSPPACSGA